MAVGSADVRAVVVPACAGSGERVIPSWTNRQADALRQALRMTNESFADYLNVSVRAVAYWRERPDGAPRKQTQALLDTGLERASEQAKALFTRLTAEAGGAPGAESDLARQSTQLDAVQETAGSPSNPEHVGAVLDDLIGADMTNRRDVARAVWVSGTAPSVITGYLFSLPAWRDEKEPLLASPSTAAFRIRAVARHLMDIDFQFGGGHVRQMLLSYFQSEIVPLLREPQPHGVRREVFSAAGEVAQLPAFSFAEPVFA